MKLFLTAFLSLLFNSGLWGQTQERSPEFSFAILNGISSQSENEDHNMAYVNAFRFQMAFNESQKYSSIIGLQYGKNGHSLNWVCEANWNYCETLGVPPIEIKTTERKHYLSFFFNSRYTFTKKYYLQGGFSLDLPVINRYRNKYVDSNGKKFRDKDVDLYSDKILLNTTFGANLIFGKKILLNKKLDLFFEMEYKMYNLIAVRFEDYEDYFFEKNQKPWVLGFNVGVSMN